MSYNSFTVVGNVTRDIESGETSKGNPFAKSAVAVSRDTKNADGGHDVDFFNFVTYNQYAVTFLTKYVKKGTKVLLAGRLETRSWEDDDGNKRTGVDFVVQSVQGLDSKPRDDDDAGESPAPSRKASTGAQERRPATTSGSRPRVSPTKEKDPFEGQFEDDD